MKYYIFSRTQLVLFLLIGVNFYPQEANEAINRSHIAFTIAEKDLLPESIAYDSQKKDFYVGSTRKGKIVKISQSGSKSNFIKPQDHGVWMIIGMKIDPERRILWVCSSGGENLVGYKLKDEEQGRPAGVFKFNLDTGQLIKKYVLNKSGDVHFFNDLVIAKNGDVYVTHMFNASAVYKISQEDDSLKVAYSSENIAYPNGITFSDDESKLYVAHSEGIAIIDLSDEKISSLKVPEGTKIARRESIDGIYFHNNSLIGVQPDIKKVQQFKLNKEGTAIVESKVLEANHPMMNNPTTGEIVENEFYYVANAQFGSFNKDGSLFPMEKLYEVCVLKLDLN